jgi:type IV pilus assembly protein PilW
MNLKNEPLGHPDQSVSVPTQRGVSLIELLISLVLGLLLIGGVLQLFLGSKATYLSTDAVARVQENGRFAMSFLEPELRMATASGFCAGDLAVTNHLNLPDAEAEALFGSRSSISGWDYSGTGRSETFTLSTPATTTDLALWEGPSDAPSVLEGLVVPGTDFFALRNLQLQIGTTGSDTATNNPQATSIVTEANHGIEACTIVLVTNCASGVDLFQPNSAANSNALTKPSGSCSPGNKTGTGLDWSTSYGSDMQLYLPVTQLYYIGIDNAITDQAVPALYRLDLVQGTSGTPQPQLLVSGIENMQVLYGISLPASLGGTGQVVDEWLTADQVTSWDVVIAVRLAALVSSQENIVGQAASQTFNLAGTSIVGLSDRKLRQTFSTTVAIRNRVLVN